MINDMVFSVLQTKLNGLHLYTVNGLHTVYMAYMISSMFIITDHRLYRRHSVGVTEGSGRGGGYSSHCTHSS